MTDPDSLLRHYLDTVVPDSDNETKGIVTEAFSLGWKGAIDAIRVLAEQTEEIDAALRPKLGHPLTAKSFITVMMSILDYETDRTITGERTHGS